MARRPRWLEGLRRSRIREVARAAVLTGNGIQEWPARKTPREDVQIELAELQNLADQAARACREAERLVVVYERREAADAEVLNRGIKE